MQKWENKYRIPSARATWWDYAKNGTYFITICTKNREHFFGECKNDKMKLSTIGAIIQGFWYEIPKHFIFVELGEFVVMPNHIHGILILNKKTDENSTEIMPIEDNKDFVQQRFRNQGKNTVSSIIGSFKSVCTKHINLLYPDYFGWQELFWDIIVKEEEEFVRISNYILNNPINWKEDNLNPDKIPKAEI